jgi:hypothetical protein
LTWIKFIFNRFIESKHSSSNLIITSLVEKLQSGKTIWIP